MQWQYTYHLDSQKRVGAVVEQIARLSVVDAHYAKHQRAAQAQREGGLRAHDLVDVLLDLVLQDLLLGELLFGIGRQPNVGQRAGALQQFGGVKHGGGGRARVEARAVELCARLVGCFDRGASTGRVYATCFCACAGGVGECAGRAPCFRNGSEGERRWVGVWWVCGVHDLRIQR